VFLLGEVNSCFHRVAEFGLHDHEVLMYASDGHFVRLCHKPLAIARHLVRLLDEVSLQQRDKRQSGNA
jgi:hypothetical protein